MADAHDLPAEVDFAPGQPADPPASEPHRGRNEPGELVGVGCVERLNEGTRLVGWDRLLGTHVHLGRDRLVAGVLGKDSLGLGGLEHERDVVVDLVHVGAA